MEAHLLKLLMGIREWTETLEEKKNLSCSTGLWTITQRAQAVGSWQEGLAPLTDVSTALPSCQCYSVGVMHMKVCACVRVNFEFNAPLLIYTFSHPTLSSRFYQDTMTGFIDHVSLFTTTQHALHTCCLSPYKWCSHRLLFALPTHWSAVSPSTLYMWLQLWLVF